MSPYFSPNIEVSSSEIAKFIAKTQCHMIETIKCNLKNQYKPNLNCDLCDKNTESIQAHLLDCPKLLGNNEIITYIPTYEDIFNDCDIREHVFIARILMDNLRRKKMLEESNVS